MLTVAELIPSEEESDASAGRRKTKPRGIAKSNTATQKKAAGTEKTKATSHDGYEYSSYTSFRRRRIAAQEQKVQIKQARECFQQQVYLWQILVLVASQSEK
jgi:hypothetical protein